MQTTETKIASNNPLLLQDVKRFEKEMFEKYNTDVRVVYDGRNDYDSNIIAMIIQASCDYFKIREFILLSKTKASEIGLVRHKIIYYLYHEYNVSIKVISYCMNRDRTSILHALKAIRNHIDTNDKGFNKGIEQYINYIDLKLKQNEV
jgi:chromosomal replication initiation ATPase DnaA